MQINHMLITDDRAVQCSFRLDEELFAIDTSFTVLAKTSRDVLQKSIPSL